MLSNNKTHKNELEHRYVTDFLNGRVKIKKCQISVINVKITFSNKTLLYKNKKHKDYCILMFQEMSITYEKYI